MNKKILIAVALFTLIFSGCGKSEESPNKDDKNTATEEKNGVTLEDRTLNLEDIGLSYVIPESWVNNTFLKTYKTDEILAKLVYTFVSDENMSKLGLDKETDNKLYKNVCEIVVCKTEHERLKPVKDLFAQYENCKEVSTVGNYSYYVLSGYKNVDLSNVSEKGQKRYKKILDDVSLLEQSITTKEFDEYAILNNQNELDKTITFSSQTIEDVKIMSTCFANYDVTLLNFGATYANDETKTLNELVDALGDYNNVNVLAAYIDTSSETDNTTAKELRKNAKFNTIVMDEKLGNWVLKKLQGVPTTVLVDSNGKIISDFIQGAKTSKEYKEYVLTALDEVKNSKK